MGQLMPVLKSISEPQISKVLTQLTPMEADHLMHLIYFGLAQGQSSVSQTMFRWHEQLVAAFGAGCILRTLTAVNLEG